MKLAIMMEFMSNKTQNKHKKRGEDEETEVMKKSHVKRLL